MSEHTSLFQALAAAQGEYPAVLKKSENPHFKNKYADLADGMDLIRPILAKHGIAYTQTFNVAEGVLLLRTSLRLGQEELTSDLPISQPAQPQQFVALTTYYRRVGLFSICGITPAGDDDDGESIRDVATTQAPPRRQAAKANGNGTRPYTRTPTEEVEDALAGDPLDPWRLDGLDTATWIATLTAGIDNRPYPEVVSAWKVYQPCAKGVLQPAEYDSVAGIMLARKERERGNKHMMAG